jgi:hypothetical protein
MSRQESTAATLVILGIIMGIGGVILDLNGAGSWIHSITWVGGGIFGYGLVTWIRLGRERKSGDLPSTRL